MIGMMVRYLIKRITDLNKIKLGGYLTDYGRGKLTVYKEVLELILNYLDKEDK